jgi:hypothetical protein
MKGSGRPVPLEMFSVSSSNGTREINILQGRFLCFLREKRENVSTAGSWMGK